MSRRALLLGSLAAVASRALAQPQPIFGPVGGSPNLGGGPLWSAGGGSPTLSLSFMVPGSLDGRITFSRASTATYFNSAGVMQTAAANAPRWDYNPNTLVLNGMLIEEQRQNLLLQSADASNAAWIKQGIGTGTAPVVTGNQAVAPDGSTTAASVAFPAVSGLGNTSRLVQNATVTANPYTFSVWLRGAVGGEQTHVTVTNGTLFYDSGVVTLTTGWQRFKVVTPALTAASWSAQVGTDLRQSASGNTSVATIYVWGMQIEQGIFPTSYIPTTSAAVTRNADGASMPTSTWFNATYGTYQAEFVPNGAAATLPVVISGNAGSPVIATGADSKLVASIRSGASVFSAAGPAFTFGAVNKAAFGYLSGASSAAVNTTLIGPSAAVLSVIGTVVEFGSDGVTPGNNSLDGWLRRAQYWPRVLSNAELQSVTT